MQTSVKRVQLRGHNFESEVTVRHRTTLGRYEASVAGYPNLVGEGVTEAAALDDLANMLGSDPTAYAEVEARIKETQAQKDAAKAKAQVLQDADSAKTEAQKDNKEENPAVKPMVPNGLKEIPPAAGAGAGQGAPVTNPGAPTGTGAGTVTSGVTHTGDVKDNLVHTEGATITKA